MKNPLRALFERRSINSTYDLLQFLLRGYGTASGVTVNEATSMNVAAVWTGIRIRSELLSTLPVDVVESSDDGRTRTRRPRHPVAQVLSQPNSWQTRSELFGMLEAHRVLRGNGYAWKNLVHNPITGFEDVRELLPMHPDQIEVVFGDDLSGPTAYKLRKRNGQTVTMPPSEVVHLKGLTTDGRMGRGFLRDLSEVIGGSLALQEHANSLWSRDATPAIALKHPKTLSPVAKNNLETSWEETYGRSKDKRRVAVLEEAMEIQQLSLTPEDGQFLETKQDLRAEIAAALGLPPHLMGLSEKTTTWGTGIEQLMIGLLTITMRPSLTTWEERLTRDLIAAPDRFSIKFNVHAFMRGDSNSQSAFFWRMIQSGVYSPNDIRALLDENPIPGGDIYLQPTNMAPLGSDPLAGNTGA